MPDPSTTRLGLYKSKSDGSELVNYSQDIGQNLDLIDSAVGFQIVTSSTRPSSPYPGKPIAESNTSYRTYFSNGTTPASASWVEIPNSSGTFGGNLALASGSSLSIGAATLTRSAGGSLNSNTNYQRTGAVTTDTAYSALVTGDGFDRVRVRADGLIEIGPGNAARDTNLYRSAADTLKTDDSLIVGTNLTVTGTSTLTGNTTVNGVLTAKNRVVGTVTITPSAANTPTSAAVTFPAALTGSTFYGVACAATTVPGTQVTGVGISGESSTGCTIYVTRTNTTATIVRYIVEWF